MSISDAIRNRIKDLSDKRHISPSKIAELGNLPKTTMQSIMRGDSNDPGISTLYHIALGLNMTVSEFLDFPEMNETLFDDE